MGIENFIQDALEKPNDYVAFHIGRELAKLYPAFPVVSADSDHRLLSLQTFGLLSILPLNTRSRRRPKPKATSIGCVIIRHPN